MVDDPSAPGAAGVSAPHPAPTQPVPVQQVPGQPAGAHAQPAQPVPPAGAHPGAPGEAAGYPPGYAPPPGYGPPPGFAHPAPTSGVKVGGAVMWSLLSIAAIALAVSLEEDGQNGWESIGVWAGFAIVAAVATLVPAVRSNLNIDATRAWQISVAGAVGLASFWVLFVLPVIERNVSFLATLGVVAGGLAAWLAPGRPAPGPGADQSW